MKPSDIKELPIIDVGKLPKEVLDKLQGLWLEYIDSIKNNNRNKAEEIRNNIDSLLFTLLSLSYNEIEQIYSVIRQIREMQKIAEESEVMIRTEEYMKEIEIRKRIQKENKNEKWSYTKP